MDRLLLLRLLGGLVLGLLLLFGLSCSKSTDPEPCYAIRYSTSGGQTVSAVPLYNCYNKGETVTLTASSGGGWQFVGWTGSVTSSQNPLPVTFTNADIALTANYVQIEHSLNIVVSPAGGGQVIGPAFQTSYTHGEQLTLTAVPNEGFEFDNWGGSLPSSLNPLTVNMTDDWSITANFGIIYYNLDVQVTGNGSVIKDPDEAQYAHGTTVSLLAVPSGDDAFAGWSGDLSGTDNPVEFEMESDRTVVATFASPFTLVFHNPVYTPIDVTVTTDDKAEAVESVAPGDSVEIYYPVNPGSITVVGTTSGHTTTDDQIGLSLRWDIERGVADLTRLSYNLVVPSDYCFLFFRNSGTEDLWPIYVNYGTSYQTIDNIVIPNDNILYQTGYYRVFASTIVRGYFPNGTTYIYWQNIDWDMVDNQSATLLNDYKSGLGVVGVGDGVTRVAEEPGHAIAVSQPGQYTIGEGAIPVSATVWNR
ncbi:MAG: hypothetical protein ABIF77_05990 [bacterium]